MNKHFVCLSISMLLLLSAVPVAITQTYRETITQPPTASPVMDRNVTEWPIIGYDPAHTSASPSIAPGTNNVLWHETVTAVAGSSPLMATGLVYVSSLDGYVYAVDAQTGGIVWTSTFLGSPLGSNPGIANGKLYISADKVYCLDALTGSEVWNQSQGAHGQSPTLENQRVYIGAEKVYCFDGTNGSLLWNFTWTNTSSFTSPAIINDAAFVLDIANAVLFSLNATTGTMNWNASLTGFGTPSTTPSVASGQIYVGTTDGWILSFNTVNGSLIWSQLIGDQIRSSPAISQGDIFFGCNDTFVYCYTGDNGSYVWSSPTGAPVDSSPAVADGKLYVSADELYCLDTLNGAAIWTYPTGGGASSPAIAEGKTFVCSATSELFAFMDNTPPNTPSNPSPANSSLNVSILAQLGWTGGDPDDDTVTYDVYFGANQTPPLVATSLSTTSYDPGMMNYSTTYYWMIIATDNHSASTSGPLWVFTTESGVPLTPATPTGPTEAGPGISLNFTTVAYDPDGDQLYYMWNWSDGNTSDWIGPFDSNQSVTLNHTFAANGSYEVRVKAKDPVGLESNWSAPLTVTIQPQVSLANIALGNIYFRIFSFNNSFFYIDLLYNLGFAIVVSNHDLYVVADASDAVHTVDFEVFGPLLNDSMVRTDNDGSDGFSASFNITRDFYYIYLTAYDANGTLIDHTVFQTLFYFRIGPVSAPPSTLHTSHMRNHRLLGT